MCKIHTPGQEVELVLYPLEDDPAAKGAGITFGDSKCLGTVKRTKAYICSECGVVFVPLKDTTESEDDAT